MKKMSLPIMLVLIGFCFSCGRSTCDCIPGHNDYNGRCRCFAPNCQCPVRLNFDMDTVGKFHVWSRYPLATSDTLYIEFLSPTFILTSVRCFSDDFDSVYLPSLPNLAKIVLPAGEYAATVRCDHIADSNRYMQKTLLYPTVIK